VLYAGSSVELLGEDLVEQLERFSDYDVALLRCYGNRHFQLQAARPVEAAAVGDYTLCAGLRRVAPGCPAHDGPSSSDSGCASMHGAPMRGSDFAGPVRVYERGPGTISMKRPTPYCPGIVRLHIIITVCSQWATSDVDAGYHG
jgi:hypothetical protein